MKSLFWCLSFFCMAQCINAQAGKFSMTVSQDTILLGNSFELKYNIENLSGKFEAPDLAKLNIVGGPNTSSNMSYINGTMTQSQGYSYHLQPTEIGVYTIMPAFLHLNDEVMETEPLDLIVLPNPDGITQSTKSKKGRSLKQQIEPNQSPKKSAPSKKRVRKKF